MAQTSMTVRIDNAQKAMFDKLCEQFGMSANTAINIFVRTVVRTKSIPFVIKASEEDTRNKALEAFQKLRQTADSGITPELSLDEINAEIKSVRQEKKQHNDICCN